ncbi:MAG: hypothetical protein KatS3mg105_3685 [Gemmatales bacterium]|nr:MAG: hypothetical protein KatS3mg105_3685 [Gemmatales bacterium]
MALYAERINYISRLRTFLTVRPNTLMVGEKNLWLEGLGGTSSAPWDDNEPPTNTGWENDTHRIGSVPPQPDIWRRQQ